MDVLGEGDWLDGEAGPMAATASVCVSRVAIRLRMGEPCSTAHFRNCAVMCCLSRLKAQIHSPCSCESKEASATTGPGAVWLRLVARNPRPQVASVIES